MILIIKVPWKNLKLSVGYSWEKYESKSLNVYQLQKNDIKTKCIFKYFFLYLLHIIQEQNSIDNLYIENHMYGCMIWLNIDPEIINWFLYNGLKEYKPFLK